MHTDLAEVVDDDDDDDSNYNYQPENDDDDTSTDSASTTSTSQPTIVSMDEIDEIPVNPNPPIQPAEPAEVPAATPPRPTPRTQLQEHALQLDNLHEEEIQFQPIQEEPGSPITPIQLEHRYPTRDRKQREPMNIASMRGQSYAQFKAKARDRLKLHQNNFRKLSF